MGEGKNFHSLPVEEKERIVGKLQRLKALSECKTGNVNETATAAAAMTRLMLEYKIEMAELEVDQAASNIIEEQDLSADQRGNPYPLWQNHLLCKLAKANDCVGFQNSSRRLFGSRSVKLCLLGRRHDIEQTRRLFRFCVDEIDRLCYVWKPRGQVSVRLRNDFRMGAAMAIGERVEQERRRVRQEEQQRAELRGECSRALAVLDRRLDEVQQAARRLGVISSSTAHGRALSASAYQAGYQAGKAVSFPGTSQPLPAPTPRQQASG